MAARQNQARITVVGTSHMRRLNDAMIKGPDPKLVPHFGLSQARVTFICQGGWTLNDVRRARPAIDASLPDFLVVQVGSNDLCSTRYVDSIRVANELLDLMTAICESSGARGAIVCHLTQRGPGKYLPSPAAAAEYNRKILLANSFIKEVLGAGLEPKLTSWPHKGMTQSMAHLLSSDGTHVNRDGQILLYKSIRGAVIRAAKEAGFPPPPTFQ